MPTGSPALSRDLPEDLQARRLHGASGWVAVSFWLGRLSGLTRAELEVARAASVGLSNKAIARSRGTSVNTTANQMASLRRTLGIGSRRYLAAMPELRMTGATARAMRVARPSARDALSAPGTALSHEEAASMWQRLAAGAWSIVAAADGAGRHHILIEPARVPSARRSERGAEGLVGGRGRTTPLHRRACSS